MNTITIKEFVHFLKSDGWSVEKEISLDKESEYDLSGSIEITSTYSGEVDIKITYEEGFKVVDGLTINSVVGIHKPLSIEGVEVIGNDGEVMEEADIFDYLDDKFTSCEIVLEEEAKL